MNIKLSYIPLLLTLLLTSQVHAQTAVRDLSAVIANGSVALEQSNGTGASSGSSVEGVLRNQTDREIRIEVYLSTPVYLRNHGKGQNMVASQIYNSDGSYFSDGKRSFITLKPRGRSRIAFVAYCADFEKDNPTSGESFSISATPPSLEKVVRNITIYARQNPDSDITVAAQVAVWLVQGKSPSDIAGKFPFSPRDEALARRFLR